MSACSFNRLLQFVNKQLDLDGQLQVYGHLDRSTFAGIRFMSFRGPE